MYVCNILIHSYVTHLIYILVLSRSKHSDIRQSLLLESTQSVQEESVVSVKSTLLSRIHVKESTFVLEMVEARGKGMMEADSGFGTG